MRKLLSPFLWFSIFMLLLLPCVYGIIIYSFHNELTLNKPKLAEEASKVLASFLLAITSLGISQLGEKLKIKRRADALTALIRSKLITEQENISVLSTTFPPLIQGNEIEELRVNSEFYVSFRDRIDSLSLTVNEAQQQLLKSEPEVIYLCSKFADAFSQVTASITWYSRKPSRDNLEQFRHSLQTLQGIISQ